MKKIANRSISQSLKDLNIYLEGKYPNDQTEKSFIKWWLDVRFDSFREYKNFIITDGTGDGGIDAIVFGEDCTHVYQMKYAKSVKPSKVISKDVKKFHDLEKMLRLGTDQEYTKWLKGVRQAWHPPYKELRNKFGDSANKIEFHFITTKSVNKKDKKYKNIIISDCQKTIPQWSRFQEGYTPTLKNIRIKLSHDFGFKIKIKDQLYPTHVGLVDVNEFKNIMDKDPNETLFVQNVRTDLKTKINDKIRETYEDKPEYFWLYNNGIYIVCDKIKEMPHSELELLSPSVINGSQTLHAINKSSKTKPAKILVRILQINRTTDRQLLRNVIIYTNSQNKMNIVNLHAAEPSQLAIKSYLDRHNIYYERKEKEWENLWRQILADYVKVNIKDLTKWLIATSLKGENIGRARAGISSIFTDNNKARYEEIFQNYDYNFNSPKYKKLLLVAWCGLFVNNLQKKISNRFPNIDSETKIARLLLIRLTFNYLKKLPTINEKIRIKFSDKFFGKKTIPYQTIRSCAGVVKELIKIQAKTKKSLDSNIDFTNFFKRDDLVLSADMKMQKNTKYKSYCNNLRDSLQEVE